MHAFSSLVSVGVALCAFTGTASAIPAAPTNTTTHILLKTEALRTNGSSVIEYWGLAPGAERRDVSATPDTSGSLVKRCGSNNLDCDVQNNLASTQFGTFFNSPDRSIRLKFEFVKY